MAKYRILRPAPEKIAVLARHGQSNDNTVPIYQRESSGLSPLGLQQAEKLAQRLSGMSLDSLRSSPLPRAAQTAKPISIATGKPIVFDELLVERRKPTWLEGKAYEDPDADRIAKDWQESLYTPGMRVQDGENFEDLVARAKAALDNLNAAEGQSVGAVTHGFFLRAVIAYVMFGEALTGPIFRALQSNMEMQNAGIAILYFGDRTEGRGWYVWSYNDHAHLG